MHANYEYLIGKRVEFSYYNAAEGQSKYVRNQGVVVGWKTYTQYEGKYDKTKFMVMLDDGTLAETETLYKVMT